jgi:hypothetical protein
VHCRKDGVSFSINDEQLQFAEGAMMFWTESASMLQQFPESEWGCPKQVIGGGMFDGAG